MGSIEDLKRVIGKKLPTGPKFQATVGTGNVKKKLRVATRIGVLKNLADNQDLINDIAKKRQADIRGGRYTRDKRVSDYRAAIKDKTLTKDDKKDLKAILELWSKGETVKASEIKKVTPNKRIERAKAIKAELRPGLIRTLPGRGKISFERKPNPLSRQAGSVREIGGSLVGSSSTKTGFAGSAQGGSVNSSTKTGFAGGINTPQGGSLAGGSGPSSSGSKPPTSFSKPPSFPR